MKPSQAKEVVLNSIFKDFVSYYIAQKGFPIKINSSEHCLCSLELGFRFTKDDIDKLQKTCDSFGGNYIIKPLNEEYIRITIYADPDDPALTI